VTPSARESDFEVEKRFFIHHFGKFARDETLTLQIDIFA